MALSVRRKFMRTVQERMTVPKLAGAMVHNSGKNQHTLTAWWYAVGSYT